jgi:hypothetical protein
MELAQLDCEARTSASASRAGMPAGEHSMTREELERDLLSLYEQLLATRLELIDGAGPADGPLHLSPGELDCVLVQLDSAIVATRSMVSSAVRAPRESESGAACEAERRSAETRRDAGSHH